MDIQNNDTDGKGPDILLVGEVRVQRHQYLKIVVQSRPQKLIVFVVFPAEKLGRVHFVVFWKLRAELMRDVVVEKNLQNLFGGLMFSRDTGVEAAK